MCQPGVDDVEGGTVDVQVVSTYGGDVVTVHKKNHTFSQRVANRCSARQYPITHSN